MKRATSHRISSYLATGLAVSFLTASAHGQSSANLNEVVPLNQLVGKPIQSSDNQSAGKLGDVVMDLESGRILYAVIDPEGGLDHKIAVPPGLFTRTPGPNLRLKVNRQALVGAPTFNLTSLEQMAQSSFVNQVYQQFGQSPWWQGSTAPDQGSFKNVHNAAQLVKMDLKNVQNKEMGKVRTAAVDLPAGRVLFVVVTPSADLNLNNQLFAMPPNAVTLSPDGQHLVSDVTREKLMAAPHFQTGREWPIANLAFASRVYEYFGKQPYFQTSGALQQTGNPQPQVYPPANNTNRWAQPNQWDQKNNQWAQTNQSQTNESWRADPLSRSNRWYQRNRLNNRPQQPQPQSQ